MIGGKIIYFRERERERQRDRERDPEDKLWGIEKRGIDYIHTSCVWKGV
jgi:hypothetical protein